jgi:hypothetical protein
LAGVLFLFVYQGDWFNDQKHGQGVQTGASGSVFHAGNWERGNPMRGE